MILGPYGIKNKHFIHNQNKLINNPRMNSTIQKNTYPMTHQSNPRVLAEQLREHQSNIQLKLEEQDSFFKT
jgi:hypothetical protein